MNNETNRPGENQPDKWNKEGDIGSTPGVNNADKKSLETDGPNKNNYNNVLNPDGSLADLPDATSHSGALDGTVGLGT